MPLPFKPETHETDPHPEVFERFAWTINNATDATFRSAIAEFMDLTELIRHVASEVFVADNDGFLGNWGMNNYYLYRLATDHVFHFIDWDKSEAFKDTPDYWIWHNHLDVARRHQEPAVDPRDVVSGSQESVSGHAAGVREPRRRRFRRAPIAADTRGWLERELDRQYALINAAVQADPNKPYSNDQFQAAVDFMRAFVQQRPTAVTNQVTASR